jgi:hypothetical protein
MIPTAAILCKVLKFPVPPHRDAPVDGVGHNGTSFPFVRGIDTASWNKETLDFVTFLFQVRKHRVECQIDDSRHIFTNNPSGPEFPYNSKHFRPEVTVILLASSLPGNTKWLARESA